MPILTDMFYILEQEEKEAMKHLVCSLLNNADCLRTVSVINSRDNACVRVRLLQ